MHGHHRRPRPPHHLAAPTATGDPDSGPTRAGNRPVTAALCDPGRLRSHRLRNVHAHGLRRCRYRGMAKTHVQHVLTAAGTNLIRLSRH
ncbi:transposase, partial [Streptomyces umbrinus]|uniref:transposase n=1 Tax=Streptomyces umbrinus TaxID=67370 RepID=UPI001BC96345